MIRRWEAGGAVFELSTVDGPDGPLLAVDTDHHTVGCEGHRDGETVTFSEEAVARFAHALSLAIIAELTARLSGVRP